MATIEEAIYSLVTADATVSGLIGTRLFPVYIPEGQSLPSVAFQRISTNRDAARTSAGAGLAIARFQFTSVATRLSQAKAVSDAIRTALDGYRGTSQSVVIDAIHEDQETMVYTDQPDRESGTYSVLLDMIVIYLE